MYILDLFKSMFKRGWTSIKSPPPRSKRVLVRSKDGSIHVGHIDPKLENIDIWIAYNVVVEGKTYQFNILEPLEWKELPN